MRMFLVGCFVALMIFGIYKLVNDDDSYDSNWNSDCQYGNEYMYPDGTVVEHSDCK